MTDWSEVREGDVVKGGDNFAWRVHKVDGPDRILVRVHDGKTWRGSPSGEVLVLSRGADLAVGVMMVHAGAIELGKKDEAGNWKQPVEYESPATLHAHLHIFHGGVGSAPDLRGLVDEHKAMHDPEAKRADTYVAHVHDPAYADA